MCSPSGGNMGPGYTPSGTLPPGPSGPVGPPNPSTIGTIQSAIGNAVATINNTINVDTTPIADVIAALTATISGEIATLIDAVQKQSSMLLMEIHDDSVLNYNTPPTWLVPLIQAIIPTYAPPSGPSNVTNTTDNTLNLTYNEFGQAQPANPTPVTVNVNVTPEGGYVPPSGPALPLGGPLPPPQYSDPALVQWVQQLITDTVNSGQAITTQQINDLRTALTIQGGQLTSQQLQLITQLVNDNQRTFLNTITQTVLPGIVQQIVGLLTSVLKIPIPAAQINDAITNVVNVAVTGVQNAPGPTTINYGPTTTTTTNTTADTTTNTTTNTTTTGELGGGGGSGGNGGGTGGIVDEDGPLLTMDQLLRLVGGQTSDTFGGEDWTVEDESVKGPLGFGGAIPGVLEPPINSPDPPPLKPPTRPLDTER